MPAGFLPVQGIIQRSFGGGELAPALHARADEVKYATGLRTCRNMQVQKPGGAANRAGTRFINACKTASPAVEIAPWQGDGITTDGMLLEIGVSYIRFYAAGALVTLAGVAAWSNAVNYVVGDIVVSGGVNYYCILPHINHVPPNATYWYAMPSNILELPHGFGATLPYWSQDGRVMTLTAPLAVPQELINLGGPTAWAIQNITTGPVVTAPTGVVLTPGAVGALRYAYVVTAAGPDYEESVASGQVINAGAAAPTTAAPHIITWAAVTNAVEYYVYGDPYGNGLYGFLGTASSGLTSFNDVGFVPDFTITPPLPITRFGVGDRPAVSSSYQQRRVFGNTANAPSEIFGSRTGFRSNFGISSPLQDDDAIDFKLASRQAQNVRHLVGLKQLIVLTDTGGWRVKGDDAGAMTPSAINADQELYTGAAPIPPCIIGNSIIYVQARGSILYDVQFDVAVEGLAGRDLTIFSSHLFEGHTIRRIDFALQPHSIVWCVREDGVLLGMTYIRELDVWGWHRHDTFGFFWDVAVVQEAAGDVVYFIVRRTINGATVRYIEKLEKREINPANFDVECFFVDAGLSYSGAPVNNVAGLAHLEAARVAILGDGAVVSNGFTGVAYTIVGGTISPALPASYSNIHVGLPYSADLETLDLDAQGGSVRDKQKGVGPVQLLLEASSRTFAVGPDSSHLTDYTAPDWEGPVDQFTGQVEISTVKTFNKYGRVFVRQRDPLPITILGIVPDVELGG